MLLKCFRLGLRVRKLLSHFKQKVKVKSFSHAGLCNTIDCSLPGSSVHGIYQARILGLPFLLQEIFPTKGLNLGLLHCGQTLYRLSHQGNL